MEFSFKLDPRVATAAVMSAVACYSIWASIKYFR